MSGKEVPHAARRLTPALAAIVDHAEKHFGSAHPNDLRELKRTLRQARGELAAMKAIDAAMVTATMLAVQQAEREERAAIRAMLTKLAEGELVRMNETTADSSAAFMNRRTMLLEVIDRLDKRERDA